MGIHKAGLQDAMVCTQELEPLLLLACTDLLLR
jgi:hypothetical protein